MATFMEKAHSLFKEHTQWQRNNPSLLSDLDLAQAIDSLWIDALKKLEQSFEDETNPLLQEKKMIAIQTINEALKGHCYLCDIQK